jgi:hypothetical protein
VIKVVPVRVENFQSPHSSAVTGSDKKEYVVPNTNSKILLGRINSASVANICARLEKITLVNDEFVLTHQRITGMNLTYFHDVLYVAQLIAVEKEDLQAVGVVEYQGSIFGTDFFELTRMSYDSNKTTTYRIDNLLAIEKMLGISHNIVQESFRDSTRALVKDIDITVNKDHCTRVRNSAVIGNDGVMHYLNETVNTTFGGSCQLMIQADINTGLAEFK